MRGVYVWVVVVPAMVLVGGGHGDLRGPVGGAVGGVGQWHGGCQRGGRG